MKIVLLANAQSVHIKQWATRLAERDHEIHVVSKDRDAFWNDWAGGTVHWLPLRGIQGYCLNAFAFRRILRSVEPDLVNAHYASGYGTTATLAGFSPTLLSVWGSDVFTFPSGSPLHRALVVRNLRAATGIASTSHVMAREVGKLVPERQSEVCITPFGVDLTRFKPLPNLRNPDYITIGTVKSLHRKYGVDTLLRAFALLVQKQELQQREFAHRLQLKIVGGGEQLSYLVRLAAGLGIENRVQFVGPVEHQAVPRWLNVFDVYVAVSREDSESFGVAVIEASACGLPVVVSDAGGLPEVVKTEVTGYVVPRDSPEMLAERLLALSVSAELRQRLGDAGRSHVAKHYGWGVCLGAMEACYEALLARRGRGVQN